MKHIYLILFASLVLVSCSKEESQTKTATKTATNTAPASSTPAVANKAVAPAAASQADFDYATLALGGRVFQKNCATCHGKEAKGEPDWRKRKPDGKLKPPPLNGTGHMWHHSKDLLLSIIANGSINKGGDMPAWGDKLSDKEMDAVVTWLQSKWPQEVYASWLEINKR